MRKRLNEDLDNMEEIMCRTADRCDIWQDRFIYAIARAVYDIIKFTLRKDEKERMLKNAV